MLQWMLQPWIETKKFPTVPNQDSRKGYSIDSIFLHYTAGGSIDSSLLWFRNPTAKVSAHFIVGRDGRIVQCVPLGLRAWHAGKGEFWIDGRMDSAWPDKVAIGIEMANYGLLHRDHNSRFYYEEGEQLRPYDASISPEPVHAELVFHKEGIRIAGWWEPYPDIQICAVRKLCAALMTEFKIPLERIVGHEDVALYVSRKTDPGPLFPWKLFMTELMNEGFDQEGPDLFRYHRTVL